MSCSAGRQYYVCYIHAGHSDIFINILLNSNIMLGIDEAGRGPVVGPMVMVGAQIKPEDLDKLKALNVKDSKLLSPKRREFLAGEIKKIAKIELVKISAKRIDELMQVMTLNKIELNAFAKIINETDAKEVYIDLPENGNKFNLALVQKLHRKNIKLISEHKADVKYPIVSAASIIAKVERDRAIKEIEEKTGLEIGSGYPADPHTKNFLEKYMEAHGEFPDFVRHSWITVQRLIKGKKQRSLLSYDNTEGV